MLQGIAPATPAAYRLFLDGAIASSRVESTGIPISMETLESNQAEVTGMIRELETDMRSSSVYYRQRRKAGKEANINSRNQLARVLYDELGIEGGVKSKNDQYVLDDETLDNMELTGEAAEYINKFRKLAKLYKLNGTYLDGLKREVVNGRLHGFFNLHLVSTYRSSSDCPNLQNFPIRNPLGSKYIRSCFRTADNRKTVLVETDYSTLEVVIGACIHKDPNMREHLLTKYDFHKATAAELFFLDEVPKAFRQLGKLANFSLIYGDYFVSIAEKMWKGAKNLSVNGVPFLEHLAKHGIKRLGNKNLLTEDSFMLRVKEVTERFWKERFPVFSEWRDETWRTYNRKGYMHTPTGFRIHGPMKRTEIFNVATQGSAYHSLLLSVIEMNRRIDRMEFRSRIVSQIHDSILSEVYVDEVDEYVTELNDVMTNYVMEKYDWITLPLSTESEVGVESWYHKKAYEAPFSLN
jgi:DNA polymerase-1